VALAESLGDDEARAKALLSLGDVATRDGQLEEAQSVLAEAIAAYEVLDDLHGRAEALRLTGMAALFHNEHERAQAPIEEALAAFRQVGDRRGEAWALQNLAWIAFARGKVAAAEERLGEAAATFTEVGDTGGLMWTLGLLSFVRYYEGRFDDAVDLASRVMRESERRGDRWGQAMMMVIIGSVDLWSGRTTAAVQTMQRSVEMFRALGDAVGRTQALGVLGRSQVMAGQVEEGLSSIAEGIVVDPSAPTLSDGGLAVLGTLPVRVQLGDPDVSDERLRVAADLRWEDRADVGQVDIGVAVAVALAQLGRVDEAQHAIEPIVAAPDVTGGVWAAAALIAAVRGDVDDVADKAKQLRAADFSTYLDRVTLYIAEGLSEVATGGRSFVAFDAARDELASTGDVLGTATLALAEAIGRTAAGDAAAEAATADAEERWARLGVDPVGWRSLFTAAATA
jgi:tetratricopeptide (TPR) repeat protein